MSDRPPLLVLIPVKDTFVERLHARYDVQYVPAGPKAALPALDAIRGVVTNGTVGFSAALMERMPKLEIVCCMGAGFENVDLAAARARGIAVTHSPGANDATVADHALGLMLALARGFVALDALTRSGKGWASGRADRPTLSGRALGLVGLGNIGRRIATRASAFDMTIAYHTRTARTDVPYRHYADPIELARASDYLVIAAPGGAATRKLVSAAVLDALGPAGYLINIARGSLVDTEALIAALRDRRIAGAGLDVYEGEPDIDARLFACENTVLTPHVAGRSPEAMAAQYAAVEANLAARFAGQPLPSEVP
jgi:lactate dehydrogenase-like 2-hydroxyacid dehydrogenase